MSAKLPASLGQKANASSFSICRSSTAGAFDLSGRTVIATASTSTKLLCDSSGKLAVNANLSGIGFSSELTIMSSETIANGGKSTTNVARITNLNTSNPQPSFSIVADQDDFTVSLQISQDNSSYEAVENKVENANSPRILSLESFGGAPTVEYYKLEITNNSGGSAVYTVKAGGFGLTMSAP